MIQQYRTLTGQTIYDICLMTYGTLDQLFKLMQDNGYQGVNTYPAPGRYFAWDDTVVLDADVSMTNSLNNVNYATANSNIGSWNYEIKESGSPASGTATPPPPPQTTSDHMYIANSTPVGAINGSNVTFTLVLAPITGSVSVYLNGIQLDPNDDYTISGMIITMAVAPNIGDKLRANFQA